MPDRPVGNFSFTVAGKGEYVDARAFADAMRETLEALSKVDESVTGVDGGSLVWQVVDAATNSPLTVRLQSVSTVVGDFSQPVLDTFLDGIEELDVRGTLPRRFPPPAIQAIKRLADLYDDGVSQVVFATPQRRYSPTHRLVEHITALVQNPRIADSDQSRPDYVELGELDGTVDSLIAHNQLYFNLYDSLSGERVKCTFKPELSEEVRAAWQKRVTVRGKIRYSADGVPKDVRVDGVSEKTNRGSLPQFKGAYINITGGVESSAHVRSIRDDD